MGINLLDNRLWDVVLERLVAAQKTALEEGEIGGTVHELDAVVSNERLNNGERHFRILASTLSAHYVLSFARAAHVVYTGFWGEHSVLGWQCGPLCYAK